MSIADQLRAYYEERAWDTSRPQEVLDLVEKGETELQARLNAIPWEAIANVLYTAKVHCFENGLGWSKDFADIDKWLVVNGQTAPEYDPGSRDAYARALAQYKRPGSEV